jgi:hypothetical protein
VVSCGARDAAGLLCRLPGVRSGTVQNTKAKEGTRSAINENEQTQDRAAAEELQERMLQSLGAVSTLCATIRVKSALPFVPFGGNWVKV